MANIDNDNASGGFLTKKKTFPIMVLIISVIAGVLFFAAPQIMSLVGLTDSKKQTTSTTANEEYFYDLEELLVTLQSEPGHQQYLKLRVSLELASSSDRDNIERLSPRIFDDFQAFLRELRVDELSGSEGWYLLKEELLIRINRAIAPSVVNEVLITDMVIQ